MQHSSIHQTTDLEKHNCCKYLMTGFTNPYCGQSMVLYMSFDKFILAVESCDLSQADKSYIEVSSFQNLSDV